MSKPEIKYNNYPAVCSVCEQSGVLVLCSDCGENLHICCGEHHLCPERCPYCGELVADGGPCNPYCDQKEHGEGFYDGDKWRRE